MQTSRRPDLAARRQLRPHSMNRRPIIVAFGPALKYAAKYGPVALEAARQLDKKLRPHVMAYRVAQQIDGYVGRWTGEDGVHWVVFASRSADPLRAFPPLPKGEADDLRREIDRSLLRHHADLPEAKFKETTVRVTRASGQVADRLRRSN